MYNDNIPMTADQPNIQELEDKIQALGEILKTVINYDPNLSNKDTDYLIDEINNILYH